MKHFQKKSSCKKRHALIIKSYKQVKRKIKTIPLVNVSLSFLLINSNVYQLGYSSFQSLCQTSFFLPTNKKNIDKYDQTEGGKGIQSIYQEDQNMENIQKESTMKCEKVIWKIYLQPGHCLFIKTALGLESHLPFRFFL